MLSQLTYDLKGSDDSPNVALSLRGMVDVDIIV